MKSGSPLTSLLTLLLILMSHFLRMEWSAGLAQPSVWHSATRADPAPATDVLTALDSSSLSSSIGGLEAFSDWLLL